MKELDWANLPFGYMKTDYNVRIYYRNEQWGALEVCSEETIPMHMAATCLHYGQEAPEVGVVQEPYPFGRLQVYIGCEVCFAHSQQGHCAGGNVFLVPSSSPARTASATLDGCVAGEAAGPRLQHNAEEREDCKERFLSERGR